MNELYKKYPNNNKGLRDLGKYIFLSVVVICFSFAVFYCGASGWWWLVALIILDKI